MALGLLNNLSALSSIVTIVIAINCIIFTFLCIWGRNKKLQQVEKWSIASICAFTFSCWMSLMLVFSRSYLPASAMNTEQERVSISVVTVVGIIAQGVTWKLGAISVFIIFLRRLEMLCLHEKVALSAAGIYSTRLSIVAGCGLLIFLLILEITCYPLSEYGVISSLYVLAAKATAYIIDLCLSLTMINLMMSTLKAITVEHGPTVNHYEVSRVERVSRAEHEATEFQSFCRITILCIYAMVSKGIYALLESLNSFWIQDREFSEFVSCVLKMFVLVNITCIMLCFQFADMWYYQMCSSCETRCGKILRTKRRSNSTWEERLLN